MFTFALGHAANFAGSKMAAYWLRSTFWYFNSTGPLRKATFYSDSVSLQLDYMQFKHFSKFRSPHWPDNWQPRKFGSDHRQALRATSRGRAWIVRAQHSGDTHRKINISRWHFSINLDHVQHGELWNLLVEPDRFSRCVCRAAKRRISMDPKSNYHGK